MAFGGFNQSEITERVRTMHEAATTVVPVPLEELEARLRQVDTWPGFLPDLQACRETSHRRYTFTVRQSRQDYEIPVVLSVHPKEHELVWRTVSGPAWNGTLRMKALDEHRTQVSLELVVQPRSGRAHLGEWFGSSHAEAELALQRLAELVSAGHH